MTSVPCDLTNPSETSTLFSNFEKDNIYINVLVLNAAITDPMAPVLNAGLQLIWAAYEVNVRTLLNLTKRFYKQPSPHHQKQKKYPLNVSTSTIHNFKTDAPVAPAYGLTKNAGTLLI